MTSDGMFVLDQLPGCPEVSVFTGGNGRAFKFAILLGRWVHLSYIVRTDCGAILRHNASGACYYAETLSHVLCVHDVRRNACYWSVAASILQPVSKFA